MQRIILDYAHGLSGGPSYGGQVVRNRIVDGEPMYEDVALLILGTPLERRLESELGLIPGRTLVLTRPDTNLVPHVQRARIANQFAGEPWAKLISIHAHRRPWTKGGRVRVIRPNRGPGPLATDALFPSDEETLSLWREISESEGFGTSLVARSIKLARDLGRGRKSSAVGLLELAGEWLGGDHIAGAAARVFRLSLVPSAVIELALGDSDDEVEEALTKRRSELVDELYRGIEAAVGWDK